MKDDTGLYWHCRHVGKEAVHVGQLCVVTKAGHRLLGPKTPNWACGYIGPLPASQMMCQSAEYIAPGGSGYVLAHGETPERLRGGERG